MTLTAVSISVKLFSEVNCPELLCSVLFLWFTSSLWTIIQHAVQGATGPIGHFLGWAVDPTDWWLSEVRSDNCCLDILSSLVKHWCSLCCCLASEGLLIFHAANANMRMISCFFSHMWIPKLRWKWLSANLWFKFNCLTDYFISLH